MYERKFGFAWKYRYNIFFKKRVSSLWFPFDFLNVTSWIFRGKILKIVESFFSIIETSNLIIWNDLKWDGKRKGLNTLSKSNKRNNFRYTVAFVVCFPYRGQDRNQSSLCMVRVNTFAKIVVIFMVIVGRNRPLRFVFREGTSRRVAIMAAKYFSLKSNEWITIVLEISPHFQPTWTRNLNFPSFYCFYYNPFFFLSNFLEVGILQDLEIPRILEIHLNLEKLCYSFNDFKCYFL